MRKSDLVQCNGRLYLQLYTGGSVDGASMLNTHKTDICLNWAGEELCFVKCDWNGVGDQGECIMQRRQRRQGSATSMILS